MAPRIGVQGVSTLYNPAFFGGQEEIKRYPISSGVPILPTGNGWKYPCLKTSSGMEWSHFSVL